MAMAQQQQRQWQWQQRPTVARAAPEDAGEGESMDRGEGGIPVVADAGCLAAACHLTRGSQLVIAAD